MTELWNGSAVSMSNPDRAWGNIEEIKLANGTPNGAATKRGRDYSTLISSPSRFP